jgi:hypothetical protein
MGIAIFKTSELKRCVEHALASTAWSMGFSEENPGPGILLVKDHGIYCMSNGEPRDIVDGICRSYVTYAKGCDPGVLSGSADWYDNCRKIAGGDDFAEFLPVCKLWLKNCDRFQELRISITANSLEATFANPYSGTPAPKKQRSKA